MGNDGGAHVNKRVDMTKQKKKEIRQGRITTAREKATLCNFSKQKLKHPLAICRLGNIYNYDELVKALINKKIPQHLRHISKLKHIKKISQSNKPEAKNSNNSEYILKCDLSGEEFNGINKFVCMWKCGCVILQKLISSPKQCPVCEKEGPSISLNLSQEEQNNIYNALVKAEEIKKEKKLNLIKQSIQITTKEEEEQKQQQDKVEKKIKKDQQTFNDQQTKQFRFSILEQLADMSKENQNQSESYQSLFHKDHEVETGLFRNSKFGVR